MPRALLVRSESDPGSLSISKNDNWMTGPGFSFYLVFSLQIVHMLKTSMPCSWMNLLLPSRYAELCHAHGKPWALRQELPAHIQESPLPQ